MTKAKQGSCFHSLPDDAHNLLRCELEGIGDNDGDKDLPRVANASERQSQASQVAHQERLRAFVSTSLHAFYAGVRGARPRRVC